MFVIGLMMILHENVYNPSKFRSDNYITTKEMKSHFLRPHLFAAKNKNSHKSTFDSTISFIILSKDRNILSFAKVQLSNINLKNDKKH